MNSSTFEFEDLSHVDKTCNVNLDGSDDGNLKVDEESRASFPNGRSSSPGSRRTVVEAAIFDGVSKVF